MIDLLKYGETGYGLMVEYDAGYINPRDKRNEVLFEEFRKQINEPSPPYAPYPFYMYAVLQKAGVENKNGRIYPYEILNPEVERYQQLIPDRSTNEYNHPECHRDTAEILTSKGWKLIKDVDPNEKVATLNTNNNQIEYHKLLRKIDEKYTGKMIKIKGRYIDLLVTPNHKFWVINKNTNKGKFITAQEILNGGSELYKYYIPKNGLWSEGEFIETFKLKGVDVKSWKKLPHELRDKYSQDIEINSIDWFRFLGLYLADGHSKGVNVIDKSNSQSVVITQKKVDNLDAIEKLFNNLPFNWQKSIRKNGTVDYIITDGRLHSYLQKLGNAHVKYIPEDIKNHSPQLLDELFTWFKMGDGRTMGNQYKQSDVFSTSKRLIDDLHEILIKIGGNGRVRREERNKDRYITENDGTKRLIKGANTKPMYFLTISQINGIWLDKRFLNVTEEEYDGRVYCVTVPNQIFYVRDNGFALWNGNSSIIDLERTSHRIVKIWWENNVLMGQLEILTSPAFRNVGQISCVGDHAALLLSYGITLGISSRGVGSLKNEHGKNIVQNDFELICFDLVSSPSTPGAYLFKDMAQVKTLPEAKEKIENVIRESKNKELINVLNKFLL